MNVLAIDTGPETSGVVCLRDGRLRWWRNALANEKIIEACLREGEVRLGRTIVSASLRKVPRASSEYGY